MSRLIQIRNRIKAIETTKKVTHAMRLISMSSHTRLRAKNEPLERYKNSIKELFHKIRTKTPEWHHPIIQPTKKKEVRQLIILIGSQKGLCGNFNNTLFNYFKRKITPEMLENTDMITIGKKATDFVRINMETRITTRYDFNANTLLQIAHELTQTILEQSHLYNKATIFSNTIQGFFIQKPQQQAIIPFIEEKTENKDPESKEEYAWEQKSTDILDFLLQQAIETEIQYRLFESLLAEQAARFISMDSATRNAKQLLEVTQLQYNKLRQATITKELTELTGSLA